MSLSDVRVTLPTRESPCATIEGRGVSLDGIDAAFLRPLLERHGALLLRGFGHSPAAFEALAARIAPTSVFNESPGRETLGGESQLQTVNLGNDAFPLHPELAREPWRPDVALFYCVRPDREGGETTICDGIGIVEALDPALVTEMATRDLLYIKPASPAALRHWLGTEFPSDAQLRDPPPGVPYWFRRAGPRIVRGFSRPLLHRPLFDERRAFANFLLFARDYLRNPSIPVLDDGNPVPDGWLAAVRAAAAPITHAVEWQPGDVILLDNSRFMHGRRAIRDAGERRIATYFGYLDGVGAVAGEPTDPVWRRETFVPPDAVAAGRDAN